MWLMRWAFVFISFAGICRVKAEEHSSAAESLAKAVLDILDRTDRAADAVGPPADSLPGTLAISIEWKRTAVLDQLMALFDSSDLYQSSVCPQRDNEIVRLQHELDQLKERYEEEKSRASSLDIKHKVAVNEASMNKLMYEQALLAVESAKFEFAEKTKALHKDYLQRSKPRGTLPVCENTAPSAKATCTVKECALLISGKYFQQAIPSGSDAPSAVDTVGSPGSKASGRSVLATVPALLSKALSLTVGAIKYEYEVFLGLLAYPFKSHVEDLASVHNPPHAEDNAQGGDTGAIHSRGSTGLLSAVVNFCTNLYFDYLHEYYEEHLEYHVDMIVNYLHIYAYYTCRFFDDIEWQEGLHTVLGSFQFVTAFADQGMEVLRDLLGDRADIVVTTVLYASGALLCVCFRKFIGGLALMVLTIALLPLLVVVYGGAKLVSLLFGSSKKAKKKVPKVAKPLSPKLVQPSSSESLQSHSAKSSQSADRSSPQQPSSPPPLTPAQPLPQAPRSSSSLQSQAYELGVSPYDSI